MRPPLPLLPPWPTSESTSRRAMGARDRPATCSTRETKRGSAIDGSATADERSAVADLQRADAAGGGLVAAGDCARPRNRANLRAPGEWRIKAQQKQRRRPRRRQRELVESPVKRVGELWKQQGERTRGQVAGRGVAHAPVRSPHRCRRRGARRPGCLTWKMKSASPIPCCRNSRAQTNLRRQDEGRAVTKFCADTERGSALQAG